MKHNNILMSFDGQLPHPAIASVTATCKNMVEVLRSLNKKV